MLVDAANDNGGKDNISVVLVRVVDGYADSMPDDDDFDLSAKLEMYGLTDVGRKRSHNEDHIAMDAARFISLSYSPLSVYFGEQQTELKRMATEAKRAARASDRAVR